MRLYAVTLELAINVVASSEDEAIRIATRSAHEECDPESYFVSCVQTGVAAKGWPNSAIPYGDLDRRSLGYWLAKEVET